MPVSGHARRVSSRVSASASVSMPDVVVGGQHRLVVLSVDTKDDQGMPGFGFAAPKHDEEDEEDTSGAFGDLELGGIDRELTRMDRARKRGRGGSMGRAPTGGGRRRRVGFAPS